MSINGHRLDYGFNPSDSELSSGSSSPNQYLSSDSLSTVTDASQHSLVSTVVHDHFRGEALRLQQQNGDAKYLRQLIQDINHLKSLVRSRDSTIDYLQKELKETTDYLKKEGIDCTKYHKNWLELYEKNYSLVLEAANQTIGRSELQKKLKDSLEMNLSAVYCVEQVEKENATLKNQLSFLKKSAVIGFIGLGTIAFVATQLKQPQSFGRSVIQMAKSFLFDRMVSSNRGAISIAKEAAIEVAHMANNTATAMINSVADSLKGVSENPVTGPDFTH